MKATQRRRAGGGFTTGEEARQAVPSKLVIIPVGPILPLLNGAGVLALSASSSPAFLMMYSAYKLNKQGDNIQL